MLKAVLADDYRFCEENRDKTYIWVFTGIPTYPVANQ